MQRGSPGAPLLLGPLGHAITSVPAGAVAAISCCTDIGVPGDACEYCMLLSESSSLSSISWSSSEFSAGATASPAHSKKFVEGLRRRSSLPRHQLAPVERRLEAPHAPHSAGRSEAWRVLVSRGHVAFVPAPARCGPGMHQSAAFGWRSSSNISKHVTLWTILRPAMAAHGGVKVTLPEL